MNIQAKLEKQGNIDVLTITLPISKQPSKSGKTTVVASTHGNFASAVVIDGQPVVIGCNAYIKR